LWACGRERVHLELETRGRPGPFAVVARTEKWQAPAFTQAPLAAARMIARSADGPDAILEGTAVSGRATTIDAAHLSTWAETVPAGKCLRVAVGAQGEGAGVELRAFDGASSTEIDRSHGANAASTTACAPAAAPRAVRFELRATSGKLDAVIGERSSG